MKKVISLLLALVLCLSLCACGAEKEASEMNTEAVETTLAVAETEPVIVETEPQFETVELTVDNWQQYFEFVDTPRWKVNAFDEVEELIEMDFVLQLKEEYLQQFVSVESGAVEIQYIPAFIRCELDFESKSVVLAEIYDVRPDIRIETATINGYDCEVLDCNFEEMLCIPAGGGITVTDVYAEFANCLYDYPTDIQVTRIQGTLTLSAE